MRPSSLAKRTGSGFDTKPGSSSTAVARRTSRSARVARSSVQTVGVRSPPAPTKAARPRSMVSPETSSNGSGTASSVPFSTSSRASASRPPDRSVHHASASLSKP